MKIKKGDKVEIIAGKEKGKRGVINLVIKDANKVVVDGLNQSTIHIKPKSGKEGQIIKRSMPLHASNVMLIDPKDDKKTRIGANGVGRDKKRVAKRSGSSIK